MTHDEAIAFLNARLNYESRGMPDQAELRVDRVAALLDLLGRPQDRYPILHVAGTKGKGSTSTMLAALLGDAGLRVGLHTSPHLRSVEERFQVDGRPIRPEELARLTAEIAPAAARIDERLAPAQPELTFFEITTALALLHFARSGVDAAVVEVGMGGRLDSTNVVDPAVCVVTNVSFDHTRQLGNTLAEIATEKAGIIKAGKQVVSGVRDEEARRRIVERCETVGATLREVGRDFGGASRSLGLEGSVVEAWTWRRRWPALRLAPVGPHQAANAALALAAVEAFLDAGASLSAAGIGPSLSSLSIPGRFEVVSRRPTVVLDVAHNPASFRALRDTCAGVLPAGHKGRRILVFGASREKDCRGMIAAVGGLFDRILVTRYSANQRALDADEVLASIDAGPACVPVGGGPEEALRLAKAELSGGSAESSETDPAGIGRDEDVICVAGSFYLVAEVRHGLLGARPAAILC